MPPSDLHRDDLILYTVTSDAMLCIFFPVLGSPYYLQLHASLDLFSSVPYSSLSKRADRLESSVFWLDRELVGESLTDIFKSAPDVGDAKTCRTRDTKDEGWDLFLRVVSDGSLVV